MNDEQEYFDKIEHVVGILVLLHFGVTWYVATTLLFVLQKACHQTKTGYSVSNHVYGNETLPITGIRQGNRLRPSLLALVSSIIIKINKAKGYRITISTPISKQEILLIDFPFVDDADLVMGADDVNTTGTVLIAKFQT